MSDGLIKTPMTEEEKQAALALLRCSFLPASFDKRFSHDMAALARSEDTGITDKQRTCLWKLVYRYRRQMNGTRLILDVADIWAPTRYLAALRSN